MSFFRKQEGNRGEEIAAKYLQKKKYRVLERNFRIRNGEIDIIALDKKTLVFVEVKTRHTSDFGTPFEAITPWKLQFVIRAAEVYAHLHPKLPRQMRIDAIAVTFTQSGEPVVEHMENISE